MAGNTGRTVYLRSDGQWANKANGELRTTSVHPDQAEACDEATSMLAAAGGGRLTVKDLTGQVIHQLLVEAG